MKKIAVLILMLAAVPAAAQEIFADSIIAAYRMGASAGQILTQMADPTNTVVQPTAADSEPMRTAKLLPAKTAAAPVEEKAGGVVIDGLVLKGGEMPFGSTSSGQLTLAADTLEWRDSKDQSKALDLSVTAIKSITARCRARSSGDFCYEVEFDIAEGNDFTFEDARQKYGGNNAIVLLLAGLDSQYPETPVKSKVRGH